MASGGNPVTIPSVRPVQTSQATVPAKVIEAAGKSLPPSGKTAVAHAAKAAHAAASTAPKQVADPPSLQSLVAHLNKLLNDSGRPYQYRVDPSSDNKVIQEVNPATGEVVGEFQASEFPALASNLGVSGLLVNSRA
jgi:uncharacterized FlaG/YvyC family protein